MFKLIYDNVKKWIGKPLPRPSFDKYMKEHWKVWVFIYLFNVIDVILTLWAMKLEGVHELNLIMAQILPNPVLFLGIKIAMVTLLMVAFCYWIFSQYTKLHKLSVGYLFLFFFIVDINNLLVIIKISNW